MPILVAIAIFVIALVCMLAAQVGNVKEEDN
jgi:hypothetical protein